MKTPSISLEQVLADKRFRIAAAVLWVAVFMVSTGFWIAAKTGPRVAHLTPALPERAYPLELLRTLPEPEPMISARTSTKSGKTAGALIRAQARTMLTRR